MGVMTTTQTWPITGTGSGRGPALTNLALAAGHQVVATTRQSTLPIEDPRLVEIQLDPADMQDCRAGRCGTLFGPLEDGVPVFSCSGRNSTPLVVLTTECPSGLPARRGLLDGHAE